MSLATINSGLRKFKNFKLNNQTGGAGFLDSQNAIAKIAFIIIVVYLFVIVLRFGVQILTWLFSPSGSPKIIDGMVDGNEGIMIPQDPAKKGSIPILRSRNEDGGIEFTWGTWLFLNNVSHTGESYNPVSHVFHKGDFLIKKGPNDDPVVDGVFRQDFVNSAPGLYIKYPESLSVSQNEDRDATDVQLIINMNTFNNVIEEISVTNIPIKKWFHVFIRVNNRNLDIYINGTIVKRHELGGVAKQNFSPVFVAQNQGFDGKISDLRYFNYALGTRKMNSIVSAGPNLKVAGKNNDIYTNPPYYGLRWYLSN